MPHVELDAIYWGPNWTPRPASEARVLLDPALAQESWVVDGNPGRPLAEPIWDRADTVVWLDYSFARVMGQLLIRTLTRSVTREALWEGNRESLRMALFSRDSILLWCLRTYWKRRREYPQRFADPRWSQLKVERFSSPGEAEAWMRGLVGPSFSLRPS